MLKINLNGLNDKTNETLSLTLSLFPYESLYLTWIIQVFVSPFNLEVVNETLLSE